jgi:hypothetical protein
MLHRVYWCSGVMLISMAAGLISQTIDMYKRDAQVWSRNQMLDGRLHGFYAEPATLFVNMK